MTDSENGYKFELALYDALPHVSDAKLGILMVDREAEFAPVKNCESIGHDTPSKAIDQVLTQHGKWLQNVNGLKIDYYTQNKILTNTSHSKPFSD